MIMSQKLKTSIYHQVCSSQNEITSVANKAINKLQINSSPQSAVEPRIFCVSHDSPKFLYGYGAFWQNGLGMDHKFHLGFIGHL